MRGTTVHGGGYDRGGNSLCLQNKWAIRDLHFFILDILDRQDRLDRLDRLKRLNIYRLD